MHLDFTVYKLHFAAPVHFGDCRSDYGVSLKTIQSDTLYAAVISCLAKLGRDIPKDGDLGCTISSAFPFYQETKETDPVYFFPKPLSLDLPKLEVITDAKKVKKVSWIDLEYFQRVINGKTLFGSDEDMQSIIHGEYMTVNRKIPDFVLSRISPRVNIPSRTGTEDARPFYMDRVYFKDYSGLFFLAEGDCDLFEQGLELLQYEGIGTDRNVGNGYFEYEKSTVSICVPEFSKRAVSLSMFIPEDIDQLSQMLDGQNVSYDFTRRGGWITDSPYNSFRKNVVHAFLPASVFSVDSSPHVRGKIVNLEPKSLGLISHPIWRSGKAIFIPIK